jgi:hypothetical protein
VSVCPKSVSVPSLETDNREMTPLPVVMSGTVSDRVFVVNA